MAASYPSARGGETEAPKTLAHTVPPAPSAETAKTHLEDALLRSRDDDRRVGALADRQYGVVERGQLDALGVGRGAVLARLQAGRLHRMYGGVYSVGHQVVSRQGRWMAAVLASGPDAVLSHWSAAALWMIRPNSRSTIDVTCPHKSRSWAGIKRHHKALPVDEITVEEGIPVTSVPRTILDLAATEPGDVVENLLREMEFLELRDRLSLQHLVERYPRRRGVRRVRTALERLKEDPPGKKKSRLEERFAPFCRNHHLPLPRFNDQIVIGNGKHFEVDCHWTFELCWVRKPRPRARPGTPTGSGRRACRRSPSASSPATGSAACRQAPRGTS